MSDEKKQKVSHGEQQFVFLGGYTVELGHVNGQGKGITVCKFDSATGVAEIVYTEPFTVNPSFLFKDPHGPYLYVTLEAYGGDMGESMLYSYLIDTETGRLSLRSVQRTKGCAACYISMDRTGDHLFVSNYLTGTVLKVKVTEGALHPPTEMHSHKDLWTVATDEGRQESAHAHCADLHPKLPYVYSCDLGCDRIVCYSWDNNKLQYKNATVCKAGAGPRHIDFSKDGKFAYTSNELNNTLDVWRCGEDGKLENLQSESTVEGTAFSNCSHVKLHPNGKFVYVANRFTDTIACFTVDTNTGRLGKRTLFPTCGKTPRHFSFDPTGQWMLVANQDTSTLVSFKVDATSGALAATAYQGIPTVTAVGF